MNSVVTQGYDAVLSPSGAAVAIVTQGYDEVSSATGPPLVPRVARRRLLESGAARLLESGAARMLEGVLPVTGFPPTGPSYSTLMGPASMLFGQADPHRASPREFAAPPAPGTTGRRLLESGAARLLESGAHRLLEGAASAPAAGRLLLESGGVRVLESGGARLLEG